MLWSLLLTIAVSVGQDVPAATPDETTPPTERTAATEPVGDEEYEEILVTDVQVSDARDAVVRRMEDLGWRSRRRRDGIVVFRGQESWMGKARLYPSGDLEFSQPVLAISGPRDAGGGFDDRQMLGNDQQSGTAGISGSALPDPRRVRAAQETIRRKIHPSVIEFRETVQKKAFSERLRNLPEQLDQLWADGTPLYGINTLETPKDRRTFVLGYWATRAPTPEGRAVCRAIEAWLRNTVQASDTPATPEEVQAAEARRDDGRRLDL